jgi:uncharacterized glyoxalase superfamily protein PhnB
MNFGYVIVYVDDVVSAVSFYEKAFGLAVRFVHESKMYAELETGATALAFAHDSMLEMHTGEISVKGEKKGFEIALTTADVETAFAVAVAAGAVEVKRPSVMPWGQKVAYVRDPFGTLVEICTPMR